MESIEKKTNSLLIVFFFPEWEYQRKGEDGKAGHHTRAGPTGLLHLLAALRPHSEAS